MKLYALEIRKSDLALITLLNSGVTPDIKKKKTYFIFDATWNTDVPNKIITQREFYNTHDIKNISPLLLAVKQV